MGLLFNSKFHSIQQKSLSFIQKIYLSFWKSVNQTPLGSAWGQSLRCWASSPSRLAGCPRQSKTGEKHFSLLLSSALHNLPRFNHEEVVFKEGGSIRVFQKYTFFKKIKSTTHLALAWGLVWKDPKGFFIPTKFRGASGHFRFDLFYIEDFHSAHSQPGHVRAEWKSTM